MSFQEVLIVGNVGRDPELRYTPDGVPVASFGVAVNKKRKGEETTTWFRVTAWRQQAEFVNQYVRQGKLVIVRGEMEQPDVWQDKTGTYRASLEITALPFGVHLLGGSSDSSPDQISSDVGKLAEQESIPF